MTNGDKIRAMPELNLIDKQKAQTEIALIAKYLAKSYAQMDGGADNG